MMVRSNNYRLKGVVDDLEEALNFAQDSYNRMNNAKVEDINSSKEELFLLLKKLQKEVDDYENTTFK